MSLFQRLRVLAHAKSRLPSEFWRFFIVWLLKTLKFSLFWPIMAQLPSFDDPIDVDSWNSDTQNAQNAPNAGDPTGYHHALGIIL